MLPEGELLLTAFHQHKQPGNKVLEQKLLFRSRDGGKSWSKAEKLDLLGLEPYLTVLRDGTIFVTGHLPKGARKELAAGHAEPPAVELGRVPRVCPLDGVGDPL